MRFEAKCEYARTWDMKKGCILMWHAKKLLLTQGTEHTCMFRYAPAMGTSSSLLNKRQ